MGRWSNTVPERQRRPHLRTAGAEYYVAVTGAAEGLGMQSMLDRFGAEISSQSLDGLQRCQSNRFQKGIVQDATHRVEVSGADQVEKGEDEANTRCGKFGGKKRFRLERTAEEMKPITARTLREAGGVKCEAGRIKAVLELNVLRGCPTTVGKPERDGNT